MSVKIKLCGMFREIDMEYANEARPDFIGFVIDFPKSRRSVDVKTARRLKSLLSPDIKAVGVFVNHPPSLAADCANGGIIDLIQLHGDEDEEYIRQLRELTSAPIIKAARVANAEDISAAMRLSADFLLLDSGQGSGECFNHSLINPDEITKPFFLAGGLTPENIAKAAESIRPFAVDLSSGIETERVKDREKMLAAVNAVRNI